MTIIIYIISAIEIITFIFLAVMCLYFLTFSIAGLFYKKNVYSIPPTKFNRILVLTPAYKEDAVISAVAEKLLNQRYPHSHFTVNIIADSLKPETITALKKLPIVVKEVSFTQSTKVKSLKAALGDFKDDEFDIALILDADNIIEDDFLLKINNKFCEGYKAIQGRRVAKNTNTSFAILDSLSEHINNHIHRKGPDSLGISANVIGSGMAFDFRLLKELININKAIGGFDRQLQLNVVERNIKIKYLHEAVIFDEKVEKAVHFSAQRRRWLSSQIYYLRKNLTAGLRKLFRGDLTYFRFAVFNNLIPPNVIYIATLLIFLTISLIFQELLPIPSAAWFLILALSMASFVLAIPKEFIRFSNLKAIVLLPAALFLMVRELFRIKGANKTFIHTPHSHIEIQK